MFEKNPRDVVVVAAVRTPVTKSGKGSLKDTRPDDLMIQCIQGLLARVPGFDPAEIGDVVIGCAFPEGEQGMNIAKIAVMGAGLPDSVPAMTINRFCSSGLQSLAQAAAAIHAGWIDCALTGGVESMSMIPMGGQKPSPNPTMMTNNPELYAPMGTTSENVAERYGVSREDQDVFALRSNERAMAALASGTFVDEIVPVKARAFVDGAWIEKTVDTDEGPRASTLEGLAKLRPVFAATGKSTAGNSSQTSDGAAANLIMTREKAEKLGLPVLAVFRGFQVVGVKADEMGVGPAYAIPALVEHYGMTVDDIDVFEINEAFASQALYSVRKAGIDPERVNLHGGAIALGHPLGCTGAKLTATLLHELKRMGAAGLFEREG
jgi:acetyl-CoA acyltransferase